MRILIIILFVVASLDGFAQKYSAIKGKVKNDKLKTVVLYKTVDGEIQKQAETQISKDGSYGFLICPETPGFYTVGDERMNFIFYLQGGEEVNIDLLENEAELVGKNTKENKTLYQWEDFAANIRLKSIYFERVVSTYEDFFPEYENFLANLETFRRSLRSGNKEFDLMLQELISYEIDYYAIMFLCTPRIKHPEKSMWSDCYYHIVSDKKFVNDKVLSFPTGIRMMNAYVSFALKLKQINGIETSLSYLHHERLKGEYIIANVFSPCKSYKEYLSAMEKYGKYIISPSQHERIEVIASELYKPCTGGIAADFTYPDVNGKMVSLSDFKGKVVLVDVWATWCGPCRGEIPHLKKLEEEMHGKDVVFLGVSVDEAKDKQKWLDFIEKEGLKGIQLLASGWSKITKDYKINGIPRFMVFDCNGNIVSVDAPRPSNPALKEMLEAELEK